MDTPPPFQGAPRRGRANWIVITLAALALLCLCCGGGALWCGRNAMPIAGCMATYGFVSAAVDDYAKDHDGKLPPADKWQEALAPYYSKVSAQENVPQGNPFINIEFADIGKPMGCVESGRVVSGMAYNTKVAGKKIADIKDPRTTPLFFEVPEAKMDLALEYTDQNAAQAPKMFFQPRGWLVLNVSGNVELVTEKGRTEVGTGATRRTKKSTEETPTPATTEEAPK
ncbi:MAG: hypothetical protein KIS66_07430 [Fimbriimonadaceae bacterium]|nr:hypothetical protein [Fimbriimonadaceae bacterium]